MINWAGTVTGDNDIESVVGGGGGPPLGLSDVPHVGWGVHSMYFACSASQLGAKAQPQKRTGFFPIVLSTLNI